MSTHHKGKNTMKWFLSSKAIDEIVEAMDQWEAFDTLQDRDPSDFGLIVEAQPVRETADAAIAVRSSMLFARWGRADIAKRFIAAAVELGLPDTTDSDVGRA
jgi:hypothetical protein